MAALWWYVLRKIIRIAKVHRLTSIADFIASRYAKDPLIGGIVTIIAVVGILPYISLQLQAVSTSFNLLHSSEGPPALHLRPDVIWHDTALYVARAPVPVELGTVYVWRSRQNYGYYGTSCVYYSKMEPLAMDPDGGTLTFVFDASPACNDRSLATPD